MREIWKDIEGYEGLYQISNLGRVKSLERTIHAVNRDFHHSEIIRKPSEYRGGYLQVPLSKNKVRKMAKIHRLVAEAFIPNPDNKPQVNHIDSNRKNNRLDNLEWVTPKENAVHSCVYGARHKPKVYGTNGTITICVDRVSQVADYGFRPDGVSRVLNHHSKKYNTHKGFYWWREGETRKELSE